MRTLDCSVGNGGRRCSDGARGFDGFDGVDGGSDGFGSVDGGLDGVDGGRWWWWTGVLDTEGTDVEVPLCPP